MINPIYTTFSAGQVYQQYRHRNVIAANDCFDRVLAVSHRVKEIAVSHGIAAERVDVIYIGSSFAEHRIPLRVNDGDRLKIAYLGYERMDKGFYHFVETLEAMPASTARRVSVLIAARIGSPSTLERLQCLAVGFLEFEIVDGYEHRTLKKLLEDVDLGVVPVLWEDNLPQVAIEYVAHGVPVLSSELGGAKELGGGNPKFVYQHGNVDDLIGKIQYFLDHKAALASYADHGMDLMDMQRHVKMMVERCYRAPVEPMRSTEGREQVVASDQAGTTA